MTLKVYNSLGHAKVPFEPIEPGKVRMYVCGVTPYDHSHMGHARCYVAFDVVFRYLKYANYEVTYVRNFTDVDDKIIKRAAEQGVPPLDLAETNIQSFHRDMDDLGVARPDHEPRVSGTIPEIIALVQQLIDNDMAYASEGDVYYAVEKFEGYGKLSGRKLEDMEAGRSGRVNAEDTKKRHPMDFALWKGAKEGEISWDSPWGPGRPGWHIECSAMSKSVLGEELDIHGGGSDLVFPHHENEIAQSEGAHNHQYVRYWLHNGFVNVDGEKMSKSLGNFFSIREVLDLYEPLVLRLFLMSTHYRHPINYSDVTLNEAAQRMGYFYETLRKVDLLLAEDIAPFNGPVEGQKFIETFEAQFREAMDDDFNTAKSMALLAEAFKLLNEFASIRKAKRKPMAAAGARMLMQALRKVDAVLNLFSDDPVSYLERHRTKAAARRELSLEWIEERIQARLDARQAKDWAAADGIRDELLEAGVVIMDGTSGTDWFVQDVQESAAPAEA
ncbi:MAG: cysteine--tRNA ligase [Bradymonadia bacterium]